MIIPVIGFVYVRVESAILRRAGVPPVEEQNSLEKPDQSSAAQVRKAA
jgi:hypothetical protein